MTNHIKATAPHGGYPSVNTGNQSITSGSGASNGFSNVPTSYGYTIGAAGSLGGSVNYTLNANDIQPVDLNLSVSGHKLMDWATMEHGDMDITFTEEEGGVWVKAKLAAAYDLTPREGLAINLLVTGIATISTMGMASRATIKPISYIRKHNLERHFNISLA